MLNDILVPSDTQIAVVGDIHAHEEQFYKLLDIIQPSEKMWFISVGDLYDKGFGNKVSEKIADEIRSMQKKGFGFIVRGNHELKHIKLAKKANLITDQLAWLEQQPLVLSFKFANQSRVTVLHGGVAPKHTWDDLPIDVEVAYIRDLDDNHQMIKLKWQWLNGRKQLVQDRAGKPWHEYYDGRFGYIASGHKALKDGIAKFYNYSCNIDTACYHTGILTCQIFNQHGRSTLHSIKGKCTGWRQEDLNG